ncbi:MAG: helicase [Phycisphaerales bacterium]|nr:MAG: helicase [Phycisphaerales bacterium]
MPGVIDDILGNGGVIARALGGDYEARPQQLRMAEAVARTLASRSHLLVEAGTGVGKSYAYLVPAVLRAVEHGETVVVATNTIALQEQIVQRDVPLLQSTLAEPDDAASDAPWRGSLRPVLVKGRGNYLSIRRLKLASQRQDRLFPDAAARRSLHVIEDWAYQTDDGTLSTLPALERPGIWDKVQSDSGNCMGRKCPNHQACFYQAARREMERANLLICNHALFFSDLALRARGVGFLPRYDHVILDEAHGAEDTAADHFGLSVSEGKAMHLLGTLFHRRTRKGYLAQLNLIDDDLRPVERAVGLVADAEEATRDFFEQLARLVERGDLPTGRMRRPEMVENALTPAMNALSVRLRSMKDLAKSEADKFELNAYAERASEIADAAEVILAQALPGYAYWVEVTRREHASRAGQGVRVSASCAPIEVAPLLKEHLFEKGHSVVLTSATLATRTVGPGEALEHAETAFAHAMTRLGCEGAETLQLGSPFDYAQQVELFVDRTMPDPNDARYLPELCARIMDHAAETKGGAFVLFTSLRTLRQAAEELRCPLEALGCPLLAQELDGSRTAMLEAFRAEPASVLFGAASFWQGVDVRGAGLRNVIITRLPFDPPDRPLTEARTEGIRARGGDPFREDSLPRAVIRFKQGFGRLVRSATDKGRVVVLDPRLVTKPYGRFFLKALPEGVPVRELR